MTPAQAKALAEAALERGETHRAPSINDVDQLAHLVLQLLDEVSAARSAVITACDACHSHWASHDDIAAMRAAANDTSRPFSEDSVADKLRAGGG